MMMLIDTEKLLKKLDPEFCDRTGFSLSENLVYLCRVGSSAHGTKISDDEYGAKADTDLFGVVIPPFDRVIGLNAWKETCSFEIDGTDLVVHSLSKYVRLLLKGNPTVLETLFVRSDDFLIVDYLLFAPFIENRASFLSRSAYSSFAGYANQQMSRMTTRDEGPTGRLGAKRKALVEKNGYDVKNACHLIRLLSMAINMLEHGDLVVNREDAGDADLLKSIKRGERSLEWVQQYARSLFDHASRARELSTLRESPDRDLAEGLLLGAYRMKWKVQ